MVEGIAGVQRPVSWQLPGPVGSSLGRVRQREFRDDHQHGGDHSDRECGKDG